MDNSTTLWSNALNSSFRDMWDGVISFIPMIIIAILIVILGWIIGTLIERIIYQIMRSLKVDEALRKAGFEEWLRHGGLNLNSGHFVGALVKWFVIIVFLVAAFDILRLYQVNEFLKDVVLSYLPQVIIAILILLASAIIADVMKRIVSASAKAAHLRSANFLGSVTKWAIWIFAVLVALDQLGIAESFVQTIFLGAVIAMSLSFGLAFGLGGQDAAAKFIDKMRQEIAEKN
ncbi:hypothetical protein A3A03_01490 [Candidatus Nomurabacteria bacterium RIFCSPLOWO2_01_FULL_40_18]|uniref:Small-conductance mechanosensitive ion channel n=1 Tax=Candidatus Nomurabacteria bacterium RIFCSPLOWO2_01_FULL_40_18 TaxID=1801773 RepID=A0A1F6XJH6_9BACT|nr:MAG: hypothetical protein A3A03_01490 [Candidatus Nomurabacteria bacterium RIFCSPLOWO2_01_FULL_40_18]